MRRHLSLYILISVLSVRTFIADASMVPKSNPKAFNSSLSRQNRTLAAANSISGNITEIQAPVNWYLTVNVLASNESYIVTWDGNTDRGEEYHLFVQLYSFNEEAKTSELQVYSDTKGYGYYSTALFKDGRFIVAWSYNSLYYRVIIKACIYDKYGNPLFLNLTVNKSLTRELYRGSVSVAVLSNQGFVIVWKQYYQFPSEFQIVGQLYDNNYTRVGDAHVLKNISDSVDLKVLSLTNGKFVILLRGIILEPYGVICEGDWSCISIPLAYSENNFPFLNAAFSFPNGDFMIFWSVSSLPKIFAQRSNENGTKVVDTIAVDVGSADFVSASAFNEGFVMAWSNKSGVYGQFFLENGTFVIVSAVDCISPSIACTNSEGCAVLWVYFNLTFSYAQGLYMTHISTPHDNDFDGLLRFLIAVLVGLAFFISYGCFLKYCRKAFKSVGTQRQQELVSITKNNEISEPNMSDDTKIMKNREGSSDERAWIVSQNLEDGEEICLLCLKNKANMIFVNCKHICCCDKCVESVDINGCCPCCGESSTFQRVTSY